MMLSDYSQVIYVGYLASVGIGLLSFALVLTGRELAKLSWFNTPGPVVEPTEDTYGRQSNEAFMALVNHMSKLLPRDSSEVKDPGST